MTRTQGIMNRALAAAEETKKESKTRLSLFQDDGGIAPKIQPNRVEIPIDNYTEFSAICQYLREE